MFLTKDLSPRLLTVEHHDRPLLELVENPVERGPLLGLQRAEELLLYGTAELFTFPESVLALGGKR
jgi:hypothetical protein